MGINHEVWCDGNSLRPLTMRSGVRSSSMEMECISWPVVCLFGEFLRRGDKSLLLTVDILVSIKKNKFVGILGIVKFG